MTLEIRPLVPKVSLVSTSITLAASDVAKVSETAATGSTNGAAAGGSAVGATGGCSTGRVVVGAATVVVVGAVVDRCQVNLPQRVFALHRSSIGARALYSWQQ